MQKNNLPIGVFDSGVGGVSVLSHLKRLMPNENYIYLGDSKNAPYGTKSHEEIFLHAEACAKYLLDKGIKALVVACNTATSVCIDDLRQKYKDTVVVGIEPALKPAVTSKVGATVVVMATPLTLKEPKFARLCELYGKEANVIPLPCPGLMELVEKGETNTKVTEDFLANCFKDIDMLSVDAVVLGCTHYPFVKDTLKKLLPNAIIYDGGEGTARQVKRLLEKDGLLTDRNTQGKIEFENTLNNDKINELAKKLLNQKIL